VNVHVEELDGSDEVTVGPALDHQTPDGAPRGDRTRAAGGTEL
jgi:hypothetical protein